MIEIYKFNSREITKHMAYCNVLHFASKRERKRTTALWSFAARYRMGV